jgi:fibronectin-binding autotransporter adhesin
VPSRNGFSRGTGSCSEPVRRAAVTAAIGLGFLLGTPRRSPGLAWNATDPGSSAISANGLTNNYGQFINESVVTNTQQGEFGTGTYLGNGWLLTALHVVSGSTYGVTVPGSSIQVNVYGSIYTLDNYQTFGSSDIVLCHLAGYTSGPAASLPGVERSQIYTGSAETGHLEQLGGFGLNGQLNSGTDVNNETFHRGFNSGNSDGGFIDVSANGSSRLVQDGYLLGYQQAGDSGSGLWMDNGPDQDTDLHDWSLIGALDTGTTPGYFGDGGQYARVSSYAGTIISTVFPHAWLTWNANTASAAATDGSGTWNLTTAHFTDGANYVFNGPERTQIATFGAGSGAAGTVTLGANISIDSLTFNAAGSGTYTIAGGGYALTLTQGSTITTNANATISAPMNGGTSTQYGAVNEVIKNGAATLTLTGPTTLTPGAVLRIDAGGVTVDTGGSVALTNAYAGIGWYSGDNAVLTVRGTGSVSDTGSPGDLNLADVGGTGVLNVQDAGVVTANNLYVGKGSTGLTGSGGTGTVNQTGGSITAPYVSLATNHPQSVGTYNLTAGTLHTASITGGLGTSTFNFNGGQIIASASSTTLMQNLTAATVNAAAAINTNGYNVTLAQPLTHSTAAPAIDGGLVKSGTGTLTLGGLSSYTGPTVISTGAVTLNPAAGAAAAAIQPVAAYSFDDVSGSTVINTGTGGPAMNGTLTGGAAIASDGKFGNAVSLSNGASVVVSNPITDTGGAADWTISAWVRTTTPGAAILDKSDGGWTWDNSVFYLGSGNGAGTGGVPSAVRYGRGFFQAGASTPSVDDGTWHLVTYVDAAGTYSIYTDGTQVGLSSGNAGFEQAVEQGGTVSFGITTDGYAGDGTVNFNGQLDEIQVYNRPLTATQIRGLYTSDSPNPAAATSVLPAATPVTLAAGASLNLNGVAQSIGGLNGPAGSTVKLGGGQLTVNASSGGTFAGIISGIGSVTKAGAGTLVLGGANSYTGTTTITGGTLRLMTTTTTAATPVASYSFSHVSGSTVINDGSGGSTLNGTLDPNGGSGFISTTGGPAAGLGALVLNGSGTTVDINAGITSLSNTATWTVSAWIKTTQQGATILDKGNGTSWSAGYSTFYLGNGNNAGSGSLPDAVRYAGGWLAGSTPVTDGTWHLITYTDAGGTQSIYVDGVPDTLSQNQFLNTDTGSVIRIGFAPTNADGELPTSGSLSGINIYSTALSPAQAAGLYSAVAGGAALPTTTNVNITAGSTLDVNGTTQTIASLSGPAHASVTLGTGTLTFNTAAAAVFSGVISGAGSIAMTGTGTQTLGGDDTFTGTTTVTAGTLNLGANLNTTGVLVRSSAGLTVTGGKLVVGSALSHLNRDVFVVGGTGVTVSGATGTLDLGTNDLDITNAGATGLAAVTGELRTGYANGSWSGPGLGSSAAAGNSSHLTALGVILNGPAYGSFDTLNPGSNDVLVKYTYYGDANLDGKVDGSDYSLIDAGYLSNGTQTGWYHGDFNYDGVIDGSDCTLIDNAFNNQGQSLTTDALVAASTAQAAGVAAPVPEPAMVSAFAGLALATLVRPRRVRPSHLRHPARGLSAGPA